MWRRARKDHLTQCTCARPDVEPIFVWRHTEPRHELAGNQAAPPAYIWLIGITASPYILTFSSHRVSQTMFVPKDTECLPGRIWSAMSALPPKADIRDDVNEKERPPCGGLSQAVRDVRYAALDF